MRDRGALSVGLVATYLGYLGRDRMLLNGGGTKCAQHVAHWLSRHVDWIVTVDAHAACSSNSGAVGLL